MDKKYSVVYTKNDRNDTILDVGLKIDNSTIGVLAPSREFDKRYGGCNLIPWIDSGAQITIKQWYEICVYWDKDIYHAAKPKDKILEDVYKLGNHNRRRYEQL